MDCSEATTMLDELALDVLPGDQRAAVLAHVGECPQCRALLDELSETADALLLAAPAVTPPAGFEDRLLDRIGEASRTPSTPVHPAGSASPAGSAHQVTELRAGARRRGERRRPAPSPVRVLAVAAVAAALLGLAGVVGHGIGSSAGGGHELATARLISADGTDLGDVVTYDGDPHWFFMRVEGAVPDGVYSCVLDTDDGKTVPIGKLWTSHGHGGWGEAVSVDPGHVKTARIVGPDGATVATARFS
ncbi:MAG TPA: zf-HC2 domain-containing protein [Acidimicrobiia bacterium]|nr:zf-HC2 domain-containing protein [Acidimicrobiia bacterium]